MQNNQWTAERVARLLNKSKRSETGWKACCPAHDDTNPSLFIADADDGIAMRCYAGCSYRDISEALKAKGCELFPSQDRREIPTSHFQLGEYHNHWDYHDASGMIVMRVCRWEQPNNKKDIRPLVRTSDGWKWQHHPVPRPLFQLDRLVNDADLPALVVEGEKTAVAAQRLLPSHIATTWAGGASAMGQTDWAPLAGRDIVLVPDCDVPGRKAMQWLRNQLEKTAASVRIVDPAQFDSKLVDGWDLADALAEQRDVAPWFEKKKTRTRMSASRRFRSRSTCWNPSRRESGCIGATTCEEWYRSRPHRAVSASRPCRWSKRSAWCSARICCAIARRSGSGRFAFGYTTAKIRSSSCAAGLPQSFDTTTSMRQGSSAIYSSHRAATRPSSPRTTSRESPC